MPIAPFSRRRLGPLAELRDPRNLYIGVQDAEMAWVILAQVAQAVRDSKLLEVANSCHEHAEVRGKWLRTRIKEAAPQVFALN